MQEESHSRCFPFSCYLTISFIALSVSQQPCLTVHADCTYTGSDYTEQQHTVWGDKDYSNYIETHNLQLLKVAHTSRTARSKKPGDMQLDTWDCVCQVAFSKHKQPQLNIKSVVTLVPALIVHSKCLYKTVCETAQQQVGSKALDSWLCVVGNCLLWKPVLFHCVYGGQEKILLENFYYQNRKSFLLDELADGPGRNYSRQTGRYTN